MRDTLPCIAHHARSTYKRFLLPLYRKTVWHVTQMYVARVSIYTSQTSTFIYHIISNRHIESMPTKLRVVILTFLLTRFIGARTTMLAHVCPFGSTLLRWLNDELNQCSGKYYLMLSLHLRYNFPLMFRPFPYSNSKDVVAMRGRLQS